MSEHSRYNSESKEIVYFRKKIKELRGDVTLRKLEEKFKSIGADVSYSSIKGYEDSTEIPLKVVLQYSKLYNISVNRLLGLDGPDLHERIFDALEFSELYEIYKGTYVLYYFNSSPSKGNDTKSTEDSLCRALITIYEKEKGIGVPNYAIQALFQCPLKTISELKHNLDRKSYCKDIEDLYNDFYKDIRTQNIDCAHYIGEFKISNSFIYCALHDSDKDIGTLMFYNSKAKSDKYKQYLGGIGASLSTSSGTSKMPCISFALLSAKILEEYISEQQISELFNIGIPRIELKYSGPEVDRIISAFNTLYGSASANNPLVADLQEKHKKMFIEFALEDLLNDILIKNMFRYQKISQNDDDMFYHQLKSFNEKVKEGRIV